MKRVFYICLIVVILGGVGVGFWFMRESNSNSAIPEISETTTTELPELLVSEAFQVLEATKHLGTFYAIVPAMTQTQTATNVVLFAPTNSAVETFVKDTALGLEKFLPYHIVSSETPIEIADGKRLKTADGQELLVVLIDGDLYIRDAKGNDVRLRKPVNAKNGKIYMIDKVLLTQ